VAAFAWLIAGAMHSAPSSDKIRAADEPYARPAISAIPLPDAVNMNLRRAIIVSP
jgi:hypothetical protein